MKVSVLGGMGMTGRCAVFDLLENPKIDEIIVGDLVKTVDFKDPRVKFIRLDVNNHEEMVKAIKGSEVVINGVQYYHNLKVMKAALDAKTNYIDFGGLYHMTLEQLKLDQQFKEMGLLAIIGMGAQPGISNIMASYAVSKLDKVDSIIIRDGWVDKTNYPKLFFTWSPSTLFDEFTLKAIHYDSNFIESEPFSVSEEYDFGGEVGKIKIFRTIHSEIATIPLSFSEKGVRYVEWREGSADIEKLKFLADIGFGKTEKIKINGYEIIPREFLFNILKEQGMLYPPENLQIRDYEITVIEATGIDEGKYKNVKVYAFFKYDENWKVSASQKEVGVPGSIVAQMIISGQIKGKGVKPPEQIVPPKQFFNELGKRDIKIKVEEKYDLN
ncbi:MAG: saccharopine dehydrogenase C-terminal domain-containing protein [Thermoplasmata archaeon]